MSVLNLTFREGLFAPAFYPTRMLATAIGDAARDLSPGTPIIILLHGYRYDPAHSRSDPHARLYATQPDPRLPKRQMSWLNALGFKGATEDPGMCVAVGWPARGSLSEAYDRAQEVGFTLARLLEAVATVLPGHPIKLMAHSLGARVALACLEALREPHVARAILLAPAEFTHVAERVLTNPAAKKAEILQISPVENWLFDKLLVRSLRHKADGTALGQAAPDAPNWVSLTLDSEGELERLAALGHRVARRKVPICHWSAYLRGGLMEFYADLLTQRDRSFLRNFDPGRPGRHVFAAE